ncbi:hypothetical protein GGR57DRAFT_98653 [Xylariaceae sp. FL1272]|nr:hypothetical protein GGR57DRAFT_98653 [Xylariaceae sp. FL1272]
MMQLPSVWHGRILCIPVLFEFLLWHAALLRYKTGSSLPTRNLLANLHSLELTLYYVKQINHTGSELDQGLYTPATIATIPHSLLCSVPDSTTKSKNGVLSQLNASQQKPFEKIHAARRLV